MQLVIKFPTRNRPEKFLSVLSTYIRFLDDKTTKIIVTADNDDLSMNNDYIKEVISTFKNVEIHFGDNKSKIEAVNADLTNVDFDIVLLASDDMIPIKRGYDTIIKNKMNEYYPDTDGILWFNDGFKGNTLNTLCILGKKYYNRFGYIYYPEYKSCWCDNEFMEVGNMLNKQTYIDEVIIRHEHPDWGFGNMDTVHQLNYNNLNHDLTLYNQRKLKKFNI